MSRDRSFSVQQLQLSKSYSAGMSATLDRTSKVSRIRRKVSDPGSRVLRPDEGGPAVTVRAERSRLVSEGELKEVPGDNSVAGCRRTILKIEQQSHIKKVAICYKDNTLFYHIDQNRPLAGILQDICDKWNLPTLDDYSLQFSEPTRLTYITERNRAEINNGNVLQLTDSPGRAAQTIIDKLKQGSREEKIDSLKNLSFKCVDATFAHEFIHKQGLTLIIGYVVSGSRAFSGDPLMYLLRSFVALMDHNVVSWDILEPEFTKQVAACVSGALAAGDGCIQPALEILESVILNSTDKAKMEMLEQFITPDKIVPYLQSQSGDVQQCALALINAMFIKSSPDRQKTLAGSFSSKTFRQVITNGILGSQQSIGPEMAHQLYKLQRLQLNMYGYRMNEKLDLTNQTQVGDVNKVIDDLRRIAFDFSDISDPTTGSSRKSGVAKDYKKLGILNQTDPIQDFKQSPGLLALDNMHYFAKCHKETYIKVVLENCGRANDQDCPFVQASIRLTTDLCELLKIGEAPYEDEQSYLPMFFTAECPFEEFFSVCIHLLNRSWKEMRASREDFSKVLNVVKEQVVRALDKNQMPKTFETFKNKLNHLAYPELKKIWDAERHRKEVSKRQARPILELRQMIKPEIYDLIKKNRLTYLENGSRFPKYDPVAKKLKNRYQYWRLAPNHKAFFYGDCNDHEIPALESLPNKVHIIDIKQLLTGDKIRQRPSGRKQREDLFLQMVLENSRPDEDLSHFFMCSTDQEFCCWEDGVNTLLNNKMTSKQTEKDLEMLLDMEIKLRLLETEGITIPLEPPPIPKLPDNYNFAYTTAS